jgi:hypothetical protein
MSFTGAIQALQAHAMALSGMKAAPDYPPEAANVFPFSVAYPAKGRLVGEAGWTKALHTIFVEIHCNRSILPKAVEQATGYLTAYPARLLADPTLGGQVDTILMSDGQPVVYEFGRLEWGGVPTVGIRFQVTFKLQE